MDCIRMEGLDGRGYLRELSLKAQRGRVPIAGSLSLTHRCNMRCAHCYIPLRERSGRAEAEELGTAGVCGLIDEIAGAGCLFFLVTGGEPLMRRDFSEVYRHAKSRGLLVTVFTNGTLVGREAVRLFKEFPPRTIEITLYGATAATYEKVTGVKGSYAACLRGVHLLLRYDLPVRLKSVLMTHNSRELGAMEAMARRLGVPFRIDSALFPRFDGDKDPLALRIPPEEAVADEIGDGARLKEWAAYYERRKGLPPGGDALYTCGAGLTHFHVDPCGYLQPCAMAVHVRRRPPAGGFLPLWRGMMPAFRARKAGPGYACNACEKRVICGLCPAFFRLETGSETRRSAYLCRMGELRFEALRGREAPGERGCHAESVV